MALGNNHGYTPKTDRRIKENLKKHQIRMEELMKEGLSKDAASKQAFSEIVYKKFRDCI
jgi:hypothetical protein